MKHLREYVQEHCEKKVYLMTEFGKSQDAIDVFPLTEKSLELSRSVKIIML